jgi:hypothetical protein
MGASWPTSQNAALRHDTRIRHSLCSATEPHGTVQASIFMAMADAVPSEEFALVPAAVVFRMGARTIFSHQGRATDSLEAGLLLRMTVLFPGAVDLAECSASTTAKPLMSSLELSDRTPFNLNRNASSRLRRPLRADCFHCEYREG